jgi:hypothetical protein
VFIQVPIILLAAMAAGPQQPASAPPPQNPETIRLPVDLEKIQRAVARQPVIRQQTSRPVFRVEVFAKKPTIEDILGPDYLKGPVPYGGMTHQEFLAMVTPDQYRGMAVFNNREAMTIAATSTILQWAVLKAVDKLKTARTKREEDAARREVMEAMNELEEARKKAGLPPKSPTP